MTATGAEVVVRTAVKSVENATKKVNDTADLRKQAEINTIK
jgi:hypothetical protein